MLCAHARLQPSNPVFVTLIIIYFARGFTVNVFIHSPGGWVLPLVGRGEGGQALSDGQEELDVVVGETEVQLLDGNLSKGREERSWDSLILVITVEPLLKDTPEMRTPLY